MERARVLVVGAIVGSVGLAFLATGGWLAPRALTPARLVDAFEHVNGPHEGFRRNHAKGIGVRGSFASNGNGARLSKAVVFQQGTVPVMGRLSFPGGMPYAADDATSVRALALRFELPNGEEWRTAMIDIPAFVVRTPEAFHEQLLTNVPDPRTGKPDPALGKAFFDAHPETQRAVGLIKARPHTDGFADDTFYGLNAFLLVGATTTPVRWKVVPLAPPPPVTTAGPNAMFDAVIQQIHARPLTWRLVMMLAGPGDAVDDATAPWPAERESVDVGTLTLDAVESEEGNEVRIVNFDPLVLPSGISPSADPLLSARSAAYAQSARRRLGEPAPSSAVGPAEVAR